MNIKDYSDVTGIILQCVTAGAIILGIRQIRINRKQLHLATITKCIDEFRKFDPPLTKNTTSEKTISTYIDLTNEELFYFQYKYLPKEVAFEWLDGMIDFIPITDKSEKILNKEYCNQFLVENRKSLFQNYPRIKNAFEIKHFYNFNLIYANEDSKRGERKYERKKLIREILDNVFSFNHYN